MTACHFSVLVIYYNNPDALALSLNRMLEKGIAAQAINVLDNGSAEEKSRDAMEYCQLQGFNFIRSDINRGWGGAINYFIGLKPWADNDLLMISAHDAWIERFSQQDVENCFDDPRVAFVCPQYPKPIVCEFTLLRSFRCRPLNAQEAHAKRMEAKVGHATLCVARPRLIWDIPFDEAYFIYGCESEIFLRCADAGYKTVIDADFVVSNPSTDSHSDFVVRAFAINDIYTAKKRGGMFGFMIRLLVVAVSGLRLWLGGNSAHAWAKLQAIVWGVKTGGQGLRLYLKK